MTVDGAERGAHRVAVPLPRASSPSTWASASIEREGRRNLIAGFAGLLQPLDRR